VLLLLVDSFTVTFGCTRLHVARLRVYVTLRLVAGWVTVTVWLVVAHTHAPHGYSFCCTLRFAVYTLRVGYVWFTVCYVAARCRLRLPFTLHFTVYVWFGFIHVTYYIRWLYGCAVARLRVGSVAPFTAFGLVAVYAHVTYAFGCVVRVAVGWLRFVARVVITRSPHSVWLRGFTRCALRLLLLFVVGCCYVGRCVC